MAKPLDVLIHSPLRP